MLEKLASIEERWEGLNKLLADPAIATDYVKTTEYARERAELDHIVDGYRRYKHKGDDRCVGNLLDSGDTE